MPTRRRRSPVFSAVQPRQGAVSIHVFEVVQAKSAELLNALGIAPLLNGRQRMHAVRHDVGLGITFVHVWNVDTWRLSPALAVRKLEGTQFRAVSSLDGGYSQRFEWREGSWFLKFVLHPSSPSGNLNFSREFDSRWGLFWIGQEAPAPAVR